MDNHSEDPLKLGIALLEIGNSPLYHHPDWPTFYKALEALIAADHQRLLSQIESELPETIHADYCDLTKNWDNPEDVLCSCDKDPQDRYRDQVQKIIRKHREGK